MKYHLAALLFSVPLLAVGGEVDGLLCDRSAPAFFAPLVHSGVMQLRPARIDRYVSFFDLVDTSHLWGAARRQAQANAPTAFGMPVVGVLGYADGQILFVQDPDRRTKNMYGVVVREEIANVQAQLRSVGAHNAHTYRLTPQLTTITCKEG